MNTFPPCVVCLQTAPSCNWGTPRRNYKVAPPALEILHIESDLVIFYPSFEGLGKWFPIWYGRYFIFESFCLFEVVDFLWNGFDPMGFITIFSPPFGRNMCYFFPTTKQTTSKPKIFLAIRTNGNWYPLGLVQWWIWAPYAVPLTKSMWSINDFFKQKFGYPWGSTLNFYHHVSQGLTPCIGDGRPPTFNRESL